MTSVTEIEKEEIDMDIAKLVQEKQTADPRSTMKSSEGPMKIHIWDFAGQELYYTTHQVIIIPLIDLTIYMRSISPISFVCKM